MPLPPPVCKILAILTAVLATAVALPTLAQTPRTIPCLPGYMPDPNPEPWRTIVPCVRTPVDPSAKSVIVLQSAGPVVVRGCGPTAETTALNIRAYGGFFDAGRTAQVYLNYKGPPVPSRIERNIKGAGWVNQVTCTPITVSKGDNIIQLRHSDGLPGVTGKAVFSFQVYDLDLTICGGTATPGLRIAPTVGESAHCVTPRLYQSQREPLLLTGCAQPAREDDIGTALYAVGIAGRRRRAKILNNGLTEETSNPGIGFWTHLDNNALIKRTDDESRVRTIVQPSIVVPMDRPQCVVDELTAAILGSCVHM